MSMSGNLEHIVSESINVALRAHATSVAGWSYREAAEYLHGWSGRFIDRFSLEVPTPAIAFQPMARRYGTYQPARNGFGLAHEIVLDVQHLKDPLQDQLNTLLHELLHEWEHVHFPEHQGSGHYHTIRFRKKAAYLGLVVNQWGAGQDVTAGPFTELLAECGITTETVAPFPIPQVMRGQTTRLKKWTCGCTIVRAAGSVRIQCLQCGAGFRRA